VWVTGVALQILLNDKYKLESLQGGGSKTRQEIPQTTGCKARACNCCTFWKLNIPNVSTYTLTSTLPILTVEITQFNIPNPEYGNI